MDSYSDSAVSFSAVFAFQLLCVRSSTYNLHRTEMKLLLEMEIDISFYHHQASIILYRG